MCVLVLLNVFDTMTLSHPSHYEQEDFFHENDLIRRLESNRLNDNKMAGRILVIGVDPSA